MDFGRLPESEINSVDFALVPDSAFTSKTLTSTGKKKDPVIYVGCAKWGRKEWVGKIYPKGTKDANFLDHYVDHFNSIELNATHYQIYGVDTIGKWGAKAKGKDFVFCPKVPQSISHFSTLVSPQAQEQTSNFLEGILAFKKHLGPIFLQVSDKFSPAKKDNLFTYLAGLPKDLQFFLEVRHPQWFSDTAIRDELFNTLRKLKIGAVITDASGRRDCVHMELPIPKTFIRFVGNSLHKTDYTRIDEWVYRMKSWLDAGLKELYFFMHQHEEAFSPELSDYTIEKMNAIMGTSLKRPLFIDEKKGKLF